MEALALSYADDTDAKMETVKEMLSGANVQENSKWIGYNRRLDTNFRRTDW